MKHYKINISLAIKLHFTNKTFICFDVDKDNKVTNYRLTDKLQRHRNKYQHFRLIEVI